MTPAGLMHKARQLEVIGCRLERILKSLPPGIVNNSTNLTNELMRSIRCVERAASGEKV